MAELTCTVVESLGEWRGVLTSTQGAGNYALVLRTADGSLARVPIREMLSGAGGREVIVMSARGHKRRWLFVEWEDGDGHAAT